MKESGMVTRRQFVQGAAALGLLGRLDPAATFDTVRGTGQSIRALADRPPAVGMPASQAASPRT